MGTYTTNKELYIPTVGEQGWGELVNGNFETIDSFLKPITVSGSTYTFTGNQTGGTITATKITNSGTLTNTGKITANGGIGTTTLTASSTSTFTGKITANGGIGTKALTTTSISNSGNMTNTGTLTSTGKIIANGGIETDVLNVDEIVATDIKGLNITTDSNLISAISLSTTTDLANTGSTGNMKPITSTKNVTYTENMLSNTVTVTCCANGGERFGEMYYGRAYLTVNGTSVLDTGNTNGTNYTVTTTITLSEGDELYAYAFTNVGTASYVRLTCNGYLCY